MIWATVNEEGIVTGLYQGKMPNTGEKVARLSQYNLDLLGQTAPADWQLEHPTRTDATGQTGTGIK